MRGGHRRRGTEIAPNLVTNDHAGPHHGDRATRGSASARRRGALLPTPGPPRAILAVRPRSAPLEQAGVAPADVDLVVFATMTPDHYFRGAAGCCRAGLGIRPVPCFRPAAQGSRLPVWPRARDAHVRAGLARNGAARGRRGALGLHAVARGQLEAPGGSVRRGGARSPRGVGGQHPARRPHRALRRRGRRGGPDRAGRATRGASSITSWRAGRDGCHQALPCRASGSGIGPTWTPARWRATSTCRHGRPLRLQMATTRMAEGSHRDPGAQRPGHRPTSAWC